MKKGETKLLLANKCALEFLEIPEMQAFDLDQKICNIDVD